MSMDAAEHNGHRRWFIFGEHADGCVDVSDGEGDVLVKIPRTIAEEIIRRRNSFCDSFDLLVFGDTILIRHADGSKTEVKVVNSDIGILGRQA
jgi:hypothetical protein